MATSPNFSWPEPDNTDLVKNGALAIRTAVDAIDASMVDLKGGTTGQVLSKTSNTDMDFTWVAQDDSNAIQNAIVDAKGDLIAATAADTPARLAVGTNGHVLTADSTAATGLTWAAPVASGMTLLSTTSLSGASTTISSISQSYNSLYVFIYGMTNNTANGTFKIEINSSTNGIYANAIQNGTVSDLDGTFLSSGGTLDRTVGNNAYSLYIDQYATTQAFKPINLYGVGYGAAYQGTTTQGGFYTGTSVVDSIKLSNTGGTFSAGVVKIYGVK